AISSQNRIRGSRLRLISKGNSPSSAASASVIPVGDCVNWLMTPFYACRQAASCPPAAAGGTMAPKGADMATHDLRAVAFATLTEAQLTALGQCTDTALRHYARGERLIETGDLAFKFFVVKSGEVEILDESGDSPRTITVHRAGGFTGDVAHLTGRAATFSAVARVDCDAYEVSPGALRRILNEHPGLGDLILHAFIARRQLRGELV